MIDPDRLLEADISAIDGDYQLLIDVLEEVVL
jgi:cell filamentation protein